MALWVALLRGINVGGRNKLPMAQLVATMEERGFRDVRTYIQSGNVVFRARVQTPLKIAKTIGDAIEERFAFRPHVVVLSQSDFEQVVADNPFASAVGEAKGTALHVFFLDAVPTHVDGKALDAAKDPGASWKTKGQAFYLHAPDGFHKSKLAAKVERLLGVPATARNWRTVSQIASLLNTPA